MIAKFAKPATGKSMVGLLPSLLTWLLWLCAPCNAQVDVLTQHNNLERTGANLRETILTPANVNVKTFGMLFRRVVDDQVYGQPLLVTDVRIDGGTHDVVYITTVNNSVYAFDANDPDAIKPFWHVNFGTPANVNDWGFGCTDTNGNMGIIGTPVIDRINGVLYVVALARIGDTFVQRLHALDITTGVDLPGSPATIVAPGFNPLLQNQRPALLLANGSVYIGYSSHCDKEPYHGFLMRYDEKSLQQIGVFNTTPTGMEGSIWQSGQAPAVDAQGNIYFVTANGTWDGKVNFGESFMRLSPELKVLDWFTPTNHEYLDSIDADLDASGATLIPGTSLVADGGKEGVLYLVDGNHMGHLGDQYAVQHFQATGSHLHSVVFWDSAKDGRLIYIWGQRDHLRVYKFDGDKLDETPLAMRSEANEGHPGAMLSLSANGNKDGILWAAIHATGDSWHESRPGILHAYDADNVIHELWNSLEDAARDDCGNYSKMAPPTIANGKVYLSSFGIANIGSGQFCVYGLLPNGPRPAPPLDVKAAVQDAKIQLTWAASPKTTTYRVKRALGQGQQLNVIASGLTTPAFTDVTAANETFYIYVVTALSSNGESDPSAEVTVSLPKPNQTSHIKH
jgi:outer membrane protein assembly factor BamB